MEHRKIASLEIIPSLLGYGCMRFPTFEDGTIDEEKAMAMVDRAFEGGVNYYVTAYFYHGGRSEDFVYRALSGRPREDYYLTSKLPTVMVHSLEDAKRIFEEQMERLRQDRLDFFFPQFEWQALARNGGDGRAGLVSGTPAAGGIPLYWILLPWNIRRISGDPDRAEMGLLPDSAQLYGYRGTGRAGGLSPDREAGRASHHYGTGQGGRAGKSAGGSGQAA